MHIYNITLAIFAALGIHSNAELKTLLTGRGGASSTVNYTSLILNTQCAKVGM